MRYNDEHFDAYVEGGDEVAEFSAFPHQLHVGAHDSFSRKMAHARLLREKVGIRREVLVDDLDGTIHRVYGCCRP